MTRARSEDRRVIYLHGGNESSTTCSRKSVRVENLILSLPPPPSPFWGNSMIRGVQVRRDPGVKRCAGTRTLFKNSKLQPLFRAFNPFPSTRSEKIMLDKTEPIQSSDWRKRAWKGAWRAAFGNGSSRRWTADGQWRTVDEKRGKRVMYGIGDDTRFS